MRDRPVLYSFRRCPYAMRARLAIYASNITVELREILLRDKPQALLNASEKGTVPVLVIDQETVLEESLDVMHWALQHSTQSDWLPSEPLTQSQEDLIHHNDTEFKYYLDRYKYFDRYPEHSQDYYLEKSLPFLNKLEKILSKQAYLGGSKFRFTDAAIAPFIRQFCMVDQQRFDQLDLAKTQTWLMSFLKSPLFNNIMKKYPAWIEGDEVTLFGNTDQA